MALSAAQVERYSRNILLREVGGVGQQRLLAATVRMLGAGPIAQGAGVYLAAHGVGRLLVEEGERPLGEVQLHAAPLAARDAPVMDAGSATPQSLQRRSWPSARESLARAVTRLTPDCAVRAWSEDQSYDLLLVCDRTPEQGASRIAAARSAGRPALVAAGSRYRAILAGFDPQGACWYCARLEVEEGWPFGATAGIAAALAAVEATKLLLGLEGTMLGRVLSHDTAAMDFREREFASRPGCRTCGMQV